MQKKGNLGAEKSLEILYTIYCSGKLGDIFLEFCTQCTTQVNSAFVNPDHDAKIT